jgi:competence protein ComEC
MAEKINLSADVLKVGHHGSKGSSSLNFLNQVKPGEAVISVGQDNKYGHPNLRVLKNFESIEAEVLRTDQLGDIIFETDGTYLIKK